MISVYLLLDCFFSRIRKKRVFFVIRKWKKNQKINKRKGAFPLKKSREGSFFLFIYNNVGIIIRDTEKKYSRCPLRGG